MLKLGVLVSGGGTNLQAIMDAVDSGVITNAEVGLVISNNPGAYALKRAESRGIPAKCISPKKFKNREEFHKALLQELQENKVDLVVLAGFLVAIPPMIVEAYPNKIINIHPSLIPSFCGVGFYGLHVHEGVLARGVKVTGATVHFVDTGTDTGPIIHTDNGQINSFFFCKISKFFKFHGTDCHAFCIFRNSGISRSTINLLYFRTFCYAPCNCMFSSAASNDQYFHELLSASYY